MRGRSRRFLDGIASGFDTGMVYALAMYWRRLIKAWQTQQVTADPQGEGQSRVHIKRQNRKSLSMRVTLSGDVEVVIPSWLHPDHPQVRRFIEQGMTKLAAHIPEERRDPFHDLETVRALVTEWAVRIGVKPGRVQFRQMTRKWGSCSSRGSITLNKALLYIPYHLVEYVVVHELVHMLVFDHSPAFWGHLGAYLPDYAARERELDTYRV
ncbi:MAG: M48 family metallopeptidase [Chloroflexota bacterium]